VLHNSTGQRLTLPTDVLRLDSDATDREKALQEQLKSYMKDRDSSNMTGLMRAETRAREETEKYKRMFEEREAAAKTGPQADLLAQVEQKSKQIERLEGMLEEREAVSAWAVLHFASGVI